MLKFKFATPPSIVECAETDALGKVPGKRTFVCACRGAGRGNKAPHIIYKLTAGSSSQAARRAFELYKRDCNECDN